MSSLHNWHLSQLQKNYYSGVAKGVQVERWATAMVKIVTGRQYWVWKNKGRLFPVPNLKQRIKRWLWVITRTVSSQLRERLQVIILVLPHPPLPGRPCECTGDLNPTPHLVFPSFSSQQNSNFIIIIIIFYPYFFSFSSFKPFLSLFLLFAKRIKIPFQQLRFVV
jgi:hypothetical protein